MRAWEGRMNALAGREDERRRIEGRVHWREGRMGA